MRKKNLVYLVTVIAVLSVMACSGKKGEEAQTAVVSDPEESAGQEQVEPETSVRASESAPSENAAVSASGDWEDAFKFVRDAIRTEPSRFALKTAEGIQWGRTGNSLEKALLLARLLQDKGKRVEVAKGVLDDAAAKRLLGTIFPPAKSFSYKSGVPLSDPAGDPVLVSAVKRHFWVRMEDGDSWADLDPSFPSAEPGKAFAPVDETLDPTDETLRANVSIALECMEGDSEEPRSVLEWAGPIGDAANRPLSLAVVARFAKAEAEEKGEEKGEEGGGVGGLFGGLSGQGSAKKKAAGEVRASYNASLTAGGDSLADGEIAAGGEQVSRISLRVKVECLGEVVSESERVLYEATGKKSEPPLFQRHAILITGDRIPASAWQDGLKAVSDKDQLADLKNRVEEIRKSLKAKKPTGKTLAAGAELEQTVGTDLGHLVNMIFASTSDDQTERAGAALSVASWYAAPRVLFTSFTGAGNSTETTIDLRQDRVEAVSLPGQARGMSQTFQYGRGVMESILEGKLLELLSGKPALTTAVLMQEAARDRIPIRMFSAREKESLKKLGPPSDVLGRLSAALDAGRVVMVPEKAVVWEGRKRWGWWTIDPQTRETIGVLDTGLHQAMLEMTILETEGPLNSKMGMVLGAMVGAIDTYWVLSALILKYGELTKEALLEAKAYMKDIQSVMCPGFEKKVGVSAGVTLIDIEDCYKKEIEIFSIEGGVEISQGWCEQFAKGFACASTSILNYYLSQFD